MKTKASVSITGIAVFLVLIAAVSAVDAAVVKVEPASQTVLPGESFSVNIVVEDVTNLKAPQAYLWFNPVAMQVTAVTEGGFLPSIGAGTAFTPQIDNTEGSVKFMDAYFPANAPFTGEIYNVSGTGRLATIQFTTKSVEGTYNLNLTDVILVNVTDNPIPTDVSNGTITGGVTPTPTADGGNGGARRDALPRKTPTTTPVPTPTEEEKTYENLTSGEEVTVKILDKELTITFKKNVSGAKIIAKELVEKPADVPDAPGIVFKYLEYIIENVSEEDIEKATIPFDVPKSWIVSENIDPITIRLNRYYESAWNPLPTEKIGEDNENIHYSAEAEGLSIFAITGEKKTEAPVTTPSSAIWIWKVVAVLLVAVIVIGVWYIKKKRQ